MRHRVAASGARAQEERGSAGAHGSQGASAPRRHVYLVAIAAGVALAAIARSALPAEHGDPFRTTLAMLPIVLAAAYAIERWMRERRLRPLAAREATALLAGTAALATAALGAPRLGLAAADPLLAVGLLLVLAYWVARVVVRLRPLLGARLPERPPAIFFWLPFVVYASLVPWTTQHRPPDGDEPYNLLVAHSLVFDRDANLENNYRRGDAARFLDRPLEPQLGDPRGPDGQIYSRHNLLLPLALALPYAVAGHWGALLAMAAATAALAWATLRLARRYFPDRPGEVLAAWSVFSFTPPLLLYSSQIWVEVPAALLVVVGLDRVHAAAVGGSRRALLGLAVPILLLPLVKIRLTLLALSLLALFVWRSVVPAGRHRLSEAHAEPARDAGGGAPAATTASENPPARVRARVLPALALAALLASTAAGILVHNQVRFGNPLKVHSLAELDLTTHPVERYLRGLAGLFFDGAFGLFACAPIWLVALPAIGVLLVKRHRLLADAAFVALPYLAFVAPRGEWYGGWSPPFRYGLAFLPLLGIALAQAFVDRRRTAPRVLCAALGGATLVLGLLWVSAPGWTYNFANGTSRVLDHVGMHLGVDLARLFPSYVRPRPAALWGPLAAAAIAASWWIPALRRRSRARVTAPAGLALGATLLLVGAPAILVAAARLPTRTVEVEDAFVAKTGGELNPPMWTIDRWRYRGAWLLPEGERIVVPVAAGGDLVEIEIEARYLRRRHPPLTLALYAGDRPLGTHDFEQESDWSSMRLGPFPWTAGAPLVLEASGPGEPAEDLQRNRLVVDRLRLWWR
ncbi:MAG TPA: hypothetical protein VMS86_08205 [Thermoanaerobaculia bacterium]|nr:hypothetical protein [Thermoanaerobaculia bacterium]